MTATLTQDAAGLRADAEGDAALNTASRVGSGAGPGTDPEARPVISVRGLRHSYAEAEVVRGLDLDVWPGEVYAFLGPNGAGKTTTLEILEGFLPVKRGAIEVLGLNPATAPSAWRDRIGIVLQESDPEPGLTVAETLELYAGYHSHPREVGETLALVGLTEHAAIRATALSGGERRRLDLALAVIGDPELLFLDEPTTGFDPAARRIAWEVIDSLRAAGRTIFLTTHYIEEAERLADRIGVIVRGQLVAEGPPGTLGGRDHAATEISFRLAGDPLGRRHTHSSLNPLEELERLAAWARDSGQQILDLDVRRVSLEDIYLKLTTDEAL